MKLLKKGMHTIYLSNIVLSFALTSSVGINYVSVPNEEISNDSEVAMVESDVLPLSQKGEEENNNLVSTVKTTKQTKVTTVVTKKEVKVSKTYVPAVYSEVTGQAVVDYAMKYKGLRYVTNGYSLSTGTDCSGFTKLIYQEFGVNISRSVQGQSRQGSYVRKADLQKGDLVFYGYGNGTVKHVGIYIGNGQVLHCSKPGDVVKISSVNMMQYITARRVINSDTIKMVEEKIEKEKNNIVLEADNKTIEENIEKDVVLENKEEIKANPSNDTVSETIINETVQEEVDTIKEEKTNTDEVLEKEKEESSINTNKESIEVTENNSSLDENQ